jgi:acyl-CoA thioesterase-2
MSELLEQLVSYLATERIDKYLFIGKSPPKPSRVFGGQVLAQALSAASRTVDPERVAHSMHGYFLRPGDPARQIVYEVDPIRDGGSFTTRRVVAKQDGMAIFNTSISFHIEEPGLEHQFELPDVPPPEDVESEFAFWERMEREQPGQIEKPLLRLIDRRPVVRRNPFKPEQLAPLQSVWMRIDGTLTADTLHHQALLAFMSDVNLLGAALLPHPVNFRTPGYQFASLDHAMWFHRRFRADDWLLYHQDSPTAGGARGFSRGTFYTREGRLVASAVQESLQRPPRGYA